MERDSLRRTSAGSERGRRGITAAALSIPLAALVACSDRAGTPTPHPTPDTSAIPPEVLAHAKDWPLPGRDYANSRATRDSRIDATTISSLDVAWEVELPGVGGYGNAATAALILGDTVYLEDLGSGIRAIDRESGNVRWARSYRDGFVVGPNGVAVGWGKVFGIAGSSDVVALDASTGDELWRKTVTRTPTEGVDIQPTLFADQVLVSSVPVSVDGIYTGGDRGILQALDQATGTLVWSFETVDSPDLWGNPELNSGGGAWFPPSIDPARGLVYWGIANPAPFPGEPEFPNGSSRPGANLYTESVVALDVRSGELRWYRQAIEHDLFDRDLIHTLLVETTVGGTARRVAVGTGKLGRVIGHDPETGELLWDTPVGLHENDDLTMLPPGETTVLPGTFGGVLTPPASADGVVYVAVLNAPSTMRPDQRAYFGGNTGTMPGQFVAVDAATGNILWDVSIDGDPTGGATVVNDLVLTATLQGWVYALRRDSGAEVWRWKAPGGINGWPAVAGDDLIWPVGLSSPAKLVALRLPR